MGGVPSGVLSTVDSLPRSLGVGEWVREGGVVVVVSESNMSSWAGER